AANVADDRMALFESVEHLEELSAEAARAFDEAVLAVALDCCDTRRTRERMSAIREPGIQHLVLELRRDVLREHDSAERQMRTGQSLRQRHQIRSARFAVALPREPLAATAEAAHHFIGNEVDAAFASELP